LASGASIVLGDAVEKDALREWIELLVALRASGVRRSTGDARGALI
jgi:hypothetical protein